MLRSLYPMVRTSRPLMPMGPKFLSCSELMRQYAYFLLFPLSFCRRPASLAYSPTLTRSARSLKLSSLKKTFFMLGLRAGQAALAYGMSSAALPNSFSMPDLFGFLSG